MSYGNAVLMGFAFETFLCKRGSVQCILKCEVYFRNCENYKVAEDTMHQLLNEAEADDCQ